MGKTNNQEVKFGEIASLYVVFKSLNVKNLFYDVIGTYPH